MIRGRLIDSGYALLGSLGWLSIPKCPMCVAAYFAAATGIAIPFAHAPALRLALLLVTASLVFGGVWRTKRRIRRRATVPDTLRARDDKHVHGSILTNGQRANDAIAASRSR